MPRCRELYARVSNAGVIHRDVAGDVVVLEVGMEGVLVFLLPFVYLFWPRWCENTTTALHNTVELYYSLLVELDAVRCFVHER